MLSWCHEKGKPFFSVIVGPSRLASSFALIGLLLTAYCLLPIAYCLLTPLLLMHPRQAAVRPSRQESPMKRSLPELRHRHQATEFPASHSISAQSHPLKPAGLN